MRIFSFFFGPSKHVQGSYCEDNHHLDYLEDDDIEEAVFTAKDRGERVDFSPKGFNNKAIHKRHDEDGRPIQQGPEVSDDYGNRDNEEEVYYYYDADYR